MERARLSTVGGHIYTCVAGCGGDAGTRAFSRSVCDCTSVQRIDLQGFAAQ